MKILAIETATRCQSVAVINDQKIIGEEKREDCSSHAGLLISTIDTLFEVIHLKINELDGLAVSIGPGSFTGLRVGLSTAMGFRIATRLPLVTVPTLEAMAWNTRGKTTIPFCPMIKASARELYWAQFQWKGDDLIRLSEDRVDLIADIEKLIQIPSLVFGEGWLASRHDLVNLLEGKCIEGPAEIMQASAYSVGLASLSDFKAKRYASTRVSPRYIQRCKAEVQLDKV